MIVWTKKQLLRLLRSLKKHNTIVYDQGLQKLHNGKIKTLKKPYTPEQAKKFRNGE